MIVGFEGARIRTDVEARIAFEELERAGGEDLGEDPGLKWFEHRYSVSYKMSSVFREGAFVDTMEVAATWDRLMHLYREVRAAIGAHALVMAHFSHAYSEGCSIYFTFVARGETRAEAERTYDAIWRDGMAAATRSGGTISHHHGVGLLKAPYMKGEHREAMRLFTAVKQSLDPEHILNPGKLGLTGTPGAGVATFEPRGDKFGDRSRRRCCRRVEPHQPRRRSCPSGHRHRADSSGCSRTPRRRRRSCRAGPSSR